MRPRAAEPPALLLALALLLAPPAAGTAAGQTGGAAPPGGASGGSAGGSGPVSGAGGGFLSRGEAAGLSGVVPGGAADPLRGERGPALGIEAPERGGFFGFPYGGFQGGGFSAPFGAVPTGGTGPFRAYEIVPSLGGSIYATDNTNPGSGRKRSDLVLSLQPEVLARADAARVSGVLRYAPSLRYFARDGGETRLDHRFNGAAQTILVPGSVFLDLRGSAEVRPVSGGFAEFDDQALPRRDRSQSFNVSATPYAVQRFGGLASGLVGYTYQYGRQGGQVAALDPGGAVFFRPQDFTAHTGFAALRSGEDFGRVGLEARVSATAYEGTGVLDGARRELAVLEGRYALTRTVILLAEGGYERQRYGGAPPFEIEEPVWALGVILEPSPDSRLLLRFQRRDGRDSPFVQARVRLGGRTLLSASYSDAIGSPAQRSGDRLGATSLDRFGVPRDAAGAPRGPDGLLAAQSGLFRNRELNAAISQTYERDTVSLSLRRSERVPLASAPGTLAFRQEGESVGLSWSRTLSEPTTLAASLRVGRVRTTVPGRPGTEGETYAARAALVHRFNPSLVGSLQYLLTNRSTEFSAQGPGFGTGDTLQNAVVATLRQTF